MGRPKRKTQVPKRAKPSRRPVSARGKRRTFVSTFGPASEDRNPHVRRSSYETNANLMTIHGYVKHKIPPQNWPASLREWWENYNKGRQG